MFHICLSKGLLGTLKLKAFLFAPLTADVHNVPLAWKCVSV